MVPSRIHMCIDYKNLDKRTIKARFPITCIDELLAKLHGVNVYMKIDLRFGY
jgi:hypothetical protein